MSKDGSLTGRLIHTARLCRTTRAQLLINMGLYAGQDALLSSLAAHDGQTMSSLAANLGVRPPTVTKMVTRLEAQSFVRRESSTTDSRVNHVYLLPEGRQLLERISGAWQEAEAAALGGIKEKDQRKLRKLLKKIRANLDGRSAEADLGDE